MFWRYRLIFCEFVHSFRAEFRNGLEEDGNDTLVNLEQARSSGNRYVLKPEEIASEPNPQT